MTCSVDGCDKESKRYGGLCWGHAKRKQLGLDVNVPLRPYKQPRSTLLKSAALAYSDVAGDEDSYRRAEVRLRMAAVRAKLTPKQLEQKRKKARECMRALRKRRRAPTPQHP